MKKKRKRDREPGVLGLAMHDWMRYCKAWLGVYEALFAAGYIYYYGMVRSAPYSFTIWVMFLHPLLDRCVSVFCASSGGGGFYTFVENPLFSDTEVRYGVDRRLYGVNVCVVRFQVRQVRMAIVPEQNPSGVQKRKQPDAFLA